MGIVVAIIGFIIAFPLRAGIVALRAQLVAVNATSAANRFSSGLIKKARSTGIGAKVLGKTQNSATKAGKKIANATQKAAVVALHAAIASLKAILALLNSLIAVLQLLDIVGLVILLVIVIVLIAAVSSAVLFMQDENLSQSVPIGGGSSIIQGTDTSSGDSSEVEDWISVCDKMGDWYVANISTYQGGTSGNYGTRKSYTCELLVKDDGTSGTVQDDCSAYVTACMQLAGYHPIGGTVYCSRDFLEGGAAANILKNNGFVNIGSLANNKDKLKKGDILAVNGHVEVFSHYGDSGQIMSWSWGYIYSSGLPTDKGLPESGSQYTDIWRLE